MSTPIIRPYDPSRDFEGGLDVFFKTINSALDHEPTRTIGSYLWYIPYVTLTPSTCLVLDIASSSSTIPRPTPPSPTPTSTSSRSTRSTHTSSHVVGYIIGAPSTIPFSQQWRDKFAPTIPLSRVPPLAKGHSDPAMQTDENRGFRKAVHNGDCSMLLPFPSLLASYPAHLHIDILPEYQGQGWGRKLVEAWCEIVKGEGAVGAHLDMVKDNVGARKFYERLGFEVCGEVLDGGESGEVGVSGDGVVLTMVKKI